MKNKLHENQLYLLRHLARFQMLSYPDCLELLNTVGTKNRIGPLLCFSAADEEQIRLQTAGRLCVHLGEGPRPVSWSNAPDLHRWWSRGAPPGHGGVPHGRSPGAQRRSCGWGANRTPNTRIFIPSACWRKIVPGILSTTRFAGMLMAGRSGWRSMTLGTAA